MNIDVRDAGRQVEVWLTNEERADPAVRQRLQCLCAHYRQARYAVIVYQSGTNDLYRSTLDLLAWNRDRAGAPALRRGESSLPTSL